MSKRDPNLTLKQIRSFLELVDAGGFTRASRTLRVGQATVSHHLNQLEEMLGVRLVNRSSRDFSVTAEGERFAAFCRQVVEGFDALRVGMESDTVEGVVHLAASTIPSAHILPGVIALLRTRHPGIRFRLTGGDSREVIEAVRAGKADAGIVGRVMKHPSLRYESLRGDQIVLVGPPGSPARIGVEAVAGIPLIVREAGSGTRQAAEEALQAQGVRPASLMQVMECSSTEAIIESVAAGIGHSFLSRLSVERAVQQGRLVVISVRGLQIERPFYLIKNNGRDSSRPVAVTLDAIRELHGHPD